MFRLIRVGSVGFPASKNLDIFNNKEIEKIIFIVPESEKVNIEEIYKSASYFNINIKDKMEVVYIKKSKIEILFIKVLKKFVNYEFIIYYTSGINKVLKNIVRKNDVLWTGDNDFDQSNYLIKYIKKNFDNFMIRTYKETRYRYDKVEKNALLYTDLLVFPNKSYITFFEEIYKLDFTNKSIFADLDWRSSYHIEYVKKLLVKKLSSIDKKLHVCILAGRVIWDRTEKRSANRYYYLDSIERLIEHGLVVHLHTPSLVKSGDEPIYEKDNPYELLAKSGNLIIEKPLNLESGSMDYKILKSYDFGLLHPIIDNRNENIAILKFQEINVPNRIFEYFLSGVMPLVQKGSGLEVENIIKENNFGIIYKDDSDLDSKLNSYTKLNFSNSEYNFSSLFTKVIKFLESSPVKKNHQ